MTDHTPSGQQAVEPVLSAAETADRLEAWAREMLASTPPKTGALHLLDAVHYLRTAAPTAQAKEAPTYDDGRDEAANFIFTGLSEALGLDGFTIQDGSETWDGDVRATLMGILRDANVIDEETNERITPPAPSVPWEEQAAQIRRDALEEAARICRDEAMMCRRDMRLVPAVTAETCASLIRALLSKPAKGDTTNAD